MDKICVSQVPGGTARLLKFKTFYEPHGGDGKTQVKKLIESTLGYRINRQRPAFLQHVGTEANSATPALMACRGNTRVFVDETDEQASGKAPAHAEDAIKALTSGGRTTGRQLYGEQITFLLQFIFIHMTNIRAKVHFLSGGMRRRVRVILFISRFLANPDPNAWNEFPIDVAMDRKVESDRWKLAMLHLRLEAWTEYHQTNDFHDDSKLPQEVKEATGEFWEAMNEVGEFMMTRYERGDEEDAPPILGTPTRSSTPFLSPPVESI